MINAVLQDMFPLLLMGADVVILCRVRIAMQSRIGSLAESLTNISIGVTIGFISNIIVLPAFGYAVTLSDGLWISLVFTAISLMRSYVIRRVYNRYNFFGKVGKMTKLDEVNAVTMSRFEVDITKRDDRFWEEQISMAKIKQHERYRIACKIYQAILEKRVLLVPVEPKAESYVKGVRIIQNLFGDDPYYIKSYKKWAVKIYKSMTQTVDTRKLIEEIEEK